MTGATSDSGVDVSLLEKRLEGLRDTQESVQGLSMWCQANKKYAPAIIETWLRCLKKSPVEKRLTLFYLANDVVQHARRKGDGTLINQWAVAVQKATPHVRSPSSVSSAIARIFKIWEERNIYSRDAVADLLALLNSSSGKEKHTSSKKPETYTARAEKVSTFQPNHLISKVKLAFRLKSHLGVTFHSKQYVNMSMDQLIGSIKDRQHGVEVVQEMAQLLEQCRTSEHKLQNEVEERRKIVETAEIGIVSYENIRNEAGIVNTAYKNFTRRVESTTEGVDEKIKAFQEMESPEPSFPGPDNTNNGNGNTSAKFAANAFENSSSNEVMQSIEADILKSINLPSTNSMNTSVPTNHYSTSNLAVSDYQHQQSYTPSQTSVPSYDLSVPTWTSESYSRMMTNMLNLQYQTPQQVSQPALASNVSASAPVFNLTPSMQLQMQQQQVAALQFSNSQGYSNNSYTSGGGLQPTKPGDVNTIPLPPVNPPLPPEPSLNSSSTVANSMFDPSRPPPLNTDYTAHVSSGQEYEQKPQYEIAPMTSPHTYATHSSYSSYNNNSGCEGDVYFNDKHNSGGTVIDSLNNLASPGTHQPFDGSFDSPTKSTGPRNRFHPYYNNNQDELTESGNEDGNSNTTFGAQTYSPIRRGRPRFSQFGSSPRPRPRFSPRTPNANGFGYRNPNRMPFKPRYPSTPERGNWRQLSGSRFTRPRNFN